MIRNTKMSWGTMARVFHWLLGLMIIGMIAYGYWMNHWAARPDRASYRLIHADIGYLVILLTALRLIWRAINPTPSQPPGTPFWQKALAYLTHALLYIWTLIVAFLGWAHSGAHKPPYASFFGWFDVPQFTSENRDAARTYEDRHILMAYVLLGLIVVHVLAALYHHFVKRDRVLMRMVDGETA